MDYVCLSIPIDIEKKDLQYSNKGITIFDEPTNDTSLMIRRGFEVLQGIYRVKHNYKKIGVTLINFTINNKELSSKFHKMSGKKFIQGNLFSQNINNQKKSNNFMKILDNINYRMGAGYSVLWFSRNKNKFKK